MDRLEAARARDRPLCPLHRAVVLLNGAIYRRYLPRLNWAGSKGSVSGPKSLLELPEPELAVAARGSEAVGWIMLASIPLAFGGTLFNAGPELDAGTVFDVGKVADAGTSSGSRCDSGLPACAIFSTDRRAASSRFMRVSSGPTLVSQATSRAFCTSWAPPANGGCAAPP